MLSVTASPASLHPATTVATATATAAAAAAAAATTPPLRAVAVPIVSPFPVPPAAGPVRVIAAVFGSRSVGRKTISIFFSETMFEATEEEEARMENTRHYTRREGMGGNWLHMVYFGKRCLFVKASIDHKKGWNRCRGGTGCVKSVTTEGAALFSIWFAVLETRLTCYSKLSLAATRGISTAPGPAEVREGGVWSATNWWKEEYNAVLSCFFGDNVCASQQASTARKVHISDRS